MLRTHDDHRWRLRLPRRCMGTSAKLAFPRLDTGLRSASGRSAARRPDAALPVPRNRRSTKGPPRRRRRARPKTGFRVAECVPTGLFLRSGSGRLLFSWAGFFSSIHLLRPCLACAGNDIGDWMILANYSSIPPGQHSRPEGMPSTSANVVNNVICGACI